MVEPRPTICVVTQGELRSLAYQFRWGARKVEAVQFLLQYFRVISIDDPDIVEAYAVMDAHSERTGHTMGKNDIWITAAAKMADATLLTMDKDYDHLCPDYVTRVCIDPGSDFTVAAHDE
jgi:predicted nucleic acid-binding protein